MKITLTELGRGFLRTYREEASEQAYKESSPSYSVKQKARKQRTLKLPIIPIEVKCPRIKISEEFKDKYDNIMSTSHMDIADLSVESIPKIFVNHMKKSNEIKNLPENQKLNKLSLKYLKLQQKYMAQRNKSDKIITNIRKKIEERMFKLGEKEEELRNQFNVQLIKPEILMTERSTTRTSLLEFIHETKYGKVWKSSPRCTVLSIPKRTKNKYQRSEMR